LPICLLLCRLPTNEPEADRAEKSPKSEQTSELKGEARARVLAQAAEPSEEKEVTFEYVVNGEKRQGKRRVMAVDLGGGVTMEFMHIPTEEVKLATSVGHRSGWGRCNAIAIRRGLGSA
jgi:hypothetical protein